ncbi:MAG: hypothetical protein E7543_06190 [Ruminococcaceae bacterium]|nr:hypothetical protein [Oscillospiraceae bacterium]
MESIKKFFCRNMTFFAIFLFLSVYGIGSIFILDTWTMPSSTYVFHLVDFSMGFCSRFLPGAIYNFLFDNTSIHAVSVYSFVMYLFFLALVAFLSQKLINKADKEIKSSLMITLLFFFTGPTIFSMLNFVRGSLDHYWIYFAALSVLFLSNKYCYGLIAVFSLLCVMVNVGAMVTYVPFIVLLMMYKTTTISNKKEKNSLWFIIMLTISLCLLLTVYFMIFERSNLVYDLEDFSAILKSRGYVEDKSYYFSTILYSEDYYDETEVAVLNSLNATYPGSIARLLFRIWLTLKSLNFEEAFYPLLLMFPALVIIFSFISKVFKSNKNKIRKFTLFCMCGMFFITIFSGLFLSTDTCRFLGHSYTILFTCALYISQYEKENTADLYKTISKKVPLCFILIYCLCYCFVLFDPVD